MAIRQAQSINAKPSPFANSKLNETLKDYNGPLSRSSKVSASLDLSVDLSSTTGFDAGAGGGGGGGGICATQNLGYWRWRLLTTQALARTITDDSRRTGR